MHAIVNTNAEHGFGISWECLITCQANLEQGMEVAEFNLPTFPRLRMASNEILLEWKRFPQPSGKDIVKLRAKPLGDPTNARQEGFISLSAVTDDYSTQLVTLIKSNCSANTVFEVEYPFPVPRGTSVAFMCRSTGIPHFNHLLRATMRRDGVDPMRSGVTNLQDANLLLSAVLYRNYMETGDMQQSDLRIKIGEAGDGEDIYFPGHKLVLAIVAPGLSALFQGEGAPNGESPLLDFAPYSYHAVQYLVRWMYTGCFGQLLSTEVGWFLPLLEVYELAESINVPNAKSRIVKVIQRFIEVTPLTDDDLWHLYEEVQRRNLCTLAMQLIPVVAAMLQDQEYKDRLASTPEKLHSLVWQLPLKVMKNTDVLEIETAPFPVYRHPTLFP